MPAKKKQLKKTVAPRVRFALDGRVTPNEAKTLLTEATRNAMRTALWLSEATEHVHTYFHPVSKKDLDQYTEVAMKYLALAFENVMAAGQLVLNGHVIKPFKVNKKYLRK